MKGQTLHAVAVWTVGLILAAGCGEDIPTGAATGGGTGDASASLDPQALLTEQDLRRQAAVPEEAAIEQETSRMGGHAMLTFTWEKPDAEAIRERNREAFQAYMAGRAESGRPQDVPTEGRVVLTIGGGRLADSPEEAARIFERALAVLERGITVGDVTLQSDRGEAVQDVGDRAFWSPEGRQLAVLSGRAVFFVDVTLHEDAGQDRELAVNLARLVIDRL